MKDNYHHGDLRNQLIQVGIRVVTTEGIEKMSLRRVAALCQVSEAAPYKHFKNKDDLMDAMQEYIEEKLMARLTKASENYKEVEQEAELLAMGKAYVMFFMEFPEYYTFLFTRAGIRIDLTSTNETDSFLPYRLFKEKAYRIYSKKGYSQEKIKYGVISMWAKVHGLAAITSMKNIVTDFEWEEVLDEIIKD